MNNSVLALLDGLGGPEVLVIGLVVLLLFGSKRMPEIGRGLGRAIREFKRATSSVEDNLREVLYEEPARPKLRPPAQLRPHRESSTTILPAASAEPVAVVKSADAPHNEPAPAEPKPAVEPATKHESDASSTSSNATPPV